MYENVDAPKMVAFPGGLTSLGRDETPAGSHWVAGYQYVDNSRPRTARNWNNLRSVAGENIGTGAAPEVVRTVPILLEIESSVSAVSAKMDDLEQLGRQQMDIYTSRLLERELWTGEIAQASDPDLPNKFLGKAGAIDVTPASVTEDEIEGLVVGISSLVNAGAVMIHVPAFLGARLPSHWRNNDALDTEGFVVVAGRGYPVDADANGLLIYGTLPVNYRLDQTDVRSSFDQHTNTFTFLAQRLAAVDFAGPVFSARVTY